MCYPKMLAKVSFGLFAVVLLGCGPNKSFSNKVDSTPAVAQKPSNDVDGQISGNVKPKIPKCDPSSVGITQARLVTDGIRLATSNQTLRYEISLINCKDGSIGTLRDQAISFDINALIPGGFKSVPYMILDSSGMELSRSSLQVMNGSDLFGNIGNFAYWATENLSYSGKQEKLILEIMLESLEILPLQVDDSEIESYLRVGKAQAVTEKLKIIR